jgi:hypothetical protein
MHSTRFTLLPCLLAFLSIPCTCLANGYYDVLAGGVPVEDFGALSSSMCGSRATYNWDALAVINNPAGLAGLTGPTTTASWGFGTWREVYEFGSDRKMNSDPMQGTRCIAAAVPVSPWLVAGTGFAVVADGDYSGTHYLNNPFLASGTGMVEFLESSGCQYEALAGLGCRLGEQISAGVSSGLRFGGVDYDYMLYDATFGTIDSVASWSTDISEMALRGGAILTGSIGAIGASYVSAGEDYPSRLSAGARVVAPHLANSTVGFEADITSPLARNLFTGKFICSYPISGDMGMNVGVSFGDYTSELGKGMGFSVGGFGTFGRTRIDIGLHWMDRVRDGAAFEGESSSEVEDSSTLVSLGLTLLP